MDGFSQGFSRLGEVYSHSRLSSFENCPKQFHYRYVLRVPAPSESIEAFVGKRVHEVLERLYRAVGRGRVPSLPQVVHRYDALFDQQYAKSQVRIAREGTDVAHYREIGARCLENYYRRHYPFDADETLGIEQRLTVKLDRHGGYRMRGIADRIVRARDRAIEIHDYKTGRRLPSQAALDRDRQLALYQLSVADRFDEDTPIRLVWHYLQHDATRTSTRSHDQLETLREETIDRIDEIRRERRFPARPTPLCNWCEYADRCPASPKRREAPELVAEPPPLPYGQLSLAF